MPPVLTCADRARCPVAGERGRGLPGSV